MNDLISRQAAIEAILRQPACHGSDGSWYHSDDIRKALTALPSAEPERKKGQWNYVDPDWRCSECGKRANINEYFLYDLTDFCPNCGADMRGEENDGKD